jgi:hypothetical protein
MKRRKKARARFWDWPKIKIDHWKLNLSIKQGKVSNALGETPEHFSQKLILSKFKYATKSYLSCMLFHLCLALKTFYFF